MAKVLVVDDEAVMRRLIELVLKEAGHEVLLAATVEEGRALLEEREIELLFSDGSIPPHRDAWRLLAQEAKERGIPFVVFSASISRDGDDPMSFAVRKEGGIPVLKQAVDKRIREAVQEALG